MAQIINQPQCNTEDMLGGTVSNGACGPNQFSLTAGNPLPRMSR